jgi:hypothetical protein
MTAAFVSELTSSSLTGETMHQNKEWGLVLLLLALIWSDPASSEVKRWTRASR